MLSFALRSVLCLSPLTLVYTAPAVAAETVKAPEVSLEEVKKLVESKGAIFLDANSSKTYKESHIPGAVSYADNKADLTKVLPSDKSALIVAYCGGPKCTAWEAAAADAKKLGYTNIKHFKGGLKVWQDAKS
jgi:rhodanese-related sulfurtransferase